MDLFHCMSSPNMEGGSWRAKSVDRDPVAPPRGVRRTSPSQSSLQHQAKLSASNGNLSKSSIKEMSRTGTWSAHYEKKKSQDSLEKLSSRTLSPPPETLPRKFSRFPSVAYSTAGRLARHPELPPLNIEDNNGPKLKDYLEKPRLVSTGGRRPSKVEDMSVEQMFPELAQLSQYYNQTFLSDSVTQAALNNPPLHRWVGQTNTDNLLQF